MHESLEPISQAPLRASIYDQLLNKIVSGSLPPGATLNESDLATKFQTSRIPVREALQELAKDRWVDLRARRSARVYQPSVSEVQDEFQIRSMCQSESAKVAAQTASPESVSALKQIVTQGKTLITEHQYVAASKLNGEFHVAVTTICDNTLLSSLVEHIEKRIQWHFSQVAAVRGLDSWLEHERIVHAIEAADAEGAESLMRQHSEETLRAYQVQPRRISRKSVN